MVVRSVTQGHHPLSQQRYPTEMCGKVTTRTEPLDNGPPVSRLASKPCGDAVSVSTETERGEDGWEGEPRGTLETHRHRKPAHGAGRLEPKGHCSGSKDSPVPCHGHHTLPVDSARLPHAEVTETEQGNPVRLPQGKVSRKASREACGHRRMEEAKAILSWGGEGLSLYALSPHAQAS